MLHPVIARAIQRGALLIAPNRRVARAVREDFDAAQAGPLWTPADVLPVDAWMAQLWHRRNVAGTETRTLLNATQQHHLWREIVAADREAQGLRSPDALAELAARAWSLVCLHDGRHRLREFPLATDHRAFERWSRSFERRLARGAWITPAQLPDELAAASDLPEKPLALIDFETHTPAVDRLFQALRDRGIEIEDIRTAAEPNSQSLFAAEDDRAELTAAADWTRSHLAANPHARIALVVPNLADRRAAIERIFGPILQPDSLPITSPAAPPVYEFSLGRPLAELPMALAALDLIAWPLKPLSVERIGALLLSPWFSSQHAPELAAFDAFELRKQRVLRPEFTLDAAIRLIQRSSRRDALAGVLYRLRSLQRAAQDAHAEFQPYGGWAETFRTVLDAAGWTRHARSNSLFFEQHRAWDSALDELATLDFDGSQPRVQDALEGLDRILRQTIFAPEPAGAPVQILGPLELGGVAFDALWFLGADDLAWPPAVSPSPLLSWQMQRALGMPGADREREDAHAASLTRRIAHAATEVVFSYAKRAEEGERRPSPLFAGLNLARRNFDSFPQDAPQTLQTVADDAELPPLPSPVVRGGSEILKLQAACAFRAFAERRLHSATPDSPSFGFDAGESGSIVHEVMQRFWNDLKTHAALTALSQHERSAALKRAIEESIRSTPESAWDEAYLAVQRRRLHALLLPWLALEARRPPFQVQPTEQKKQFPLGPLTLDLRIDRIDSTAAGDIILDYKTGEASPNQWQGDRPEEPQLPLYAVLAQTEGRKIAGVAYGSLRAGTKLAMRGYTEDASLFTPSAMEAGSLAEQIDAWHATLYTLAEAFAAGDSRVLPKDYPRTCKYCSQRILCRLNPDLLAPREDDEEETADVY